MRDDALEFEVTDAERRHLRSLFRSPGYRVVQKIQRAYMDAVKDSAIALGQGDPLGDKDELANKWAYVAAARQYVEHVEAGISFELALLEEKDKPKAAPAELARRRRLHQLSGSLTPFQE